MSAFSPSSISSLKRPTCSGDSDAMAPLADAEAVKARLKKEGFDEISAILDREATQRRILTVLYDELVARGLAEYKEY